MQHFDIRLGNSGFFREFAFYVFIDIIERTIEHPANKPKGEHIFASKHTFIIESEFFQTFAGKLGNWHRNFYVIIKIQLCKRIVGGKICLRKIFIIE